MFHRNKNKGGIHLRRSEVNVLNPPLLFRKHTLCHRRADWLQWHNNMVCSQAERVPGLVGQAWMMGRRLQDEVMAVLKQVRTADQLQQKRFPFSYLKKKVMGVTRRAAKKQPSITEPQGQSSQNL